MNVVPRCLLLLLLCALLTACGPASTVMLVGNVVNAAGHAVTDKQLADRTPQDDVNEAYEEILQVNAAEGDPESQYQLGMFYVSKRDGAALQWVCRAAAAGHSKAQLQMGHWYSEDRLQSDLWPFIDIRPNDNQAYAWYSLAEKNGDEDAALFRMVLRDNRMNAEQVNGAMQLASHGQTAGCERVLAGN
jgi:TPR repeat protein